MDLLERVMGVPMAAPETATLRAKRHVATALLVAFAVLVALQSFGCAGRAIALTSLLVGVAAAIEAGRWMVAKVKADRAWAAELLARDDPSDGTGDVQC